MKKKPLNTASVLKEIIAGLNPDVIKGYEMPTLCNMETAKETGFAVVMVLSTKFDYTNDILDEWMKRLEADDYIISVKHNQLQVRFNVMYAKKRGEITMAAKDYQICPALFNVYIAKVSKRNPNEMTDDRRVITENEILMLIDWFLDKELVDTHNTLSFPSHAREGKRIQLRFIDENKEK